jgi:Tol biopolymer transport system component
MKKLLKCLLFVSLSLGEGWGEAFAQWPDTDIFLADVKTTGGNLSFGKPMNITNRKGYDNQPYFMPNGKGLLFISQPDTLQTDVYKYDFASKKISQQTFSKESDFSPALSPDGKNISVVRIDADTAQRLHNLPLSNLKSDVTIKGSELVGYFCWLNDSSVAMFILGDAFSLQILNTKTSERKWIASDVGRCMKLSPDKKKMFFVLKQNPNEWAIFSLDIATLKMTKVVSTLKDSEDFAVMNDGSFLMGSEGKLYQYKNNNWNPVADFSASLKDFYRISINAKGYKIAVVAYTGKKP